MWRPDSFFKNAKAVTFQTMTIPNHYMWLYKDKTILYMVKLTLRLSCAMNFLIYPHDTQECKLQMESCKYYRSKRLYKFLLTQNVFLVSHTTDDMIFQWDPDVPLVVDEHIELPQLALVKNYTADCTQVYSTGEFVLLHRQSSISFLCLLQRKLHVFGSRFCTKTSPGLLSLPHIRTHMSYCHHVLGLLLDQARSCTCQSHVRSYITSHPLNTTR